ncbi:MAG TPA: cupin domain-containing protein [Chloroflexota bacterium]|nr:cupin domain-containing protein [Chloroflexota bacterium]
MTDNDWRSRSIKLSFWDYFLEQEGIPVYRGNYVEDVYTLELGDWERVGGRGAYLSMANQQVTNGYVVEIAPGSQLEPEHHLFEKIMYVLSGNGATEVWQGEGKPLTFEWQAGSFFAIPLNAHHRLFNGSGTQPARLMAATTAPQALNMYHNREFIFDNSFVFKDRFDPEQSDYFTAEGHSWGTRSWETNFVADVRAFKLEDWEAKGKGARHMRFVMAEGVYGCHIHELSPVTYVQAHRHAAGAMILILSGSGYEVMYFDKAGPRTRMELKPGSIVSPSTGQYHLHCNPNAEPLRQIAFRGGGFSLYGAGVGGPEAHMSELVPYDQEDPSVHEEFYLECRSRGLEPVLMPIKQGPG